VAGLVTYRKEEATDGEKIGFQFKACLLRVQCPNQDKGSEPLNPCGDIVRRKGPTGGEQNR
jgi:hypothetical protein